MIRRLLSRTALTFLLALVCGGALLATSQYVQRAERQLRDLEREIASTREQTHILQAEWHYLNAPQRLEVLASQHLDMAQPEYTPNLPKDLSKVFIQSSQIPQAGVSPIDPSGSFSSLIRDISFSSSGEGGVND